MSRKPEQLLWDALRRRLQDRDGDLWLQRVENGMGAGMPDVLLIRDGGVLWVETKRRPDLPVRHSTPLLGERYGLNVDQRNWHHKWAAHGGDSQILISAGARLQEVFLVSGAFADEVNGLTLLTLRSLASLPSPSRGVHRGWEAIKSRLLAP